MPTANNAIARYWPATCALAGLLCRRSNAPDASINPWATAGVIRNHNDMFLLSGPPGRINTMKTDAPKISRESSLTVRCRLPPAECAAIKATDKITNSNAGSGYINHNGSTGFLSIAVLIIQPTSAGIVINPTIITSRKERR